MSKSAKKSCISYEQVHVHPHVSAIKTLNQEDQCDVYLCEDGVIKGNTSKCGKPIISCAIETFSYYELCDLGASMSQVERIGWIVPLDSAATSVQGSYYQCVVSSLCLVYTQIRLAELAGSAWDWESRTRAVGVPWSR
jgi:hypothetical protein